MTRHPCGILLLFILLAAGPFADDTAMSSPCAQKNVNLSERDNGSTIDIGVGTNLNIILKVPPQEVYVHSCLWSGVIASNGGVLRTLQREVLLPTGVTAAFFRAIRPGAVQLRSHRYDCSKRANIEWRVEVRVV